MSIRDHAGRWAAKIQECTVFLAFPVSDEHFPAAGPGALNIV